jgi:uncharacterized protein YycO
MKNFYLKLLHLVTSWLAQHVATKHVPYIEKKISYKDVISMKEVIQKGDFFVTRTDGFMSTALIPGYWKHAGIYLGDDKIIDATGLGVQVRYLQDLVMNTDNISFLRLKNMSDDEIDSITKYAISQEGKPYNYGMDLSLTTKFYCSELVFDATNIGLESCYFQEHKTLGMPSFTPNDLYDEVKDGRLNIVWEKRGDK